MQLHGFDNAQTGAVVVEDLVGSTETVGLAGAAGSGVGHTGGWGDLAAEHPADGPNHSLSGESRTPVPEGVRQIQEDLVVPSDGEEKGEPWVEQQESIPAAEINLEHVEFCPRV